MPHVIVMVTFLARLLVVEGGIAGMEVLLFAILHNRLYDHPLQSMNHHFELRERTTRVAFDLLSFLHLFASHNILYVHLVPKVEEGIDLVRQVVLVFSTFEGLCGQEQVE